MESEDRKRTGENGQGSCLELEVLLAEYAEGNLPEAERAGVKQHLAHCVACAGALHDMSVALEACRRAGEVPPPPGMVVRILEQTTGKLTWRQHLRLWVRPVLEPRLAMGLAMALISFSIILNSSGADVRHMSLADLSPSRVYKQLDRKVHLAGTRALKYYQDLRIVYEIQTQLQAIRETATPPESRPRQPQSREQPQPQPPAHNKWSRQAAYVAATVF